MKKNYLCLILVGLTVLASGCATNKNKDVASLDGYTHVKALCKPLPDAPYRNDRAITKAYAEKTKVIIDWEQAPSDQGQFNEKVNVLMASGDIPDLISLSVTDAQKGGLNGVFAPLNDLIDKMPNYKKVLEANPDNAKIIRSEDGKYYVFASLEAVKTQATFITRQDWLDKLSLPQPKTTDDLYNVLKAFKEKDPNGNGKADEVPFTTRLKADGLKCFWESFGIGNDGTDFYVDNGVVKYKYSSVNFKDAIAYTNKLYKEGLIDNEYSINDSKAWESKISNQLSGMTSDMFTRVDYFDNSLKKVDPKANVTGLLPLNGADGNPFTLSQQQSIGSTVSVNSKSTKKEAIAKMIDYGFSAEGQLLLNFGIEGEDYTMVNGSPKYTDKIMKNSDKSPLIMLMLEGKMPFPYKFDIRYENEMITPKLKEVRDSIVPYIKTPFPSFLNYKSAEQKIIDSVGTQVKTYKDEMIDRFVCGNEPLANFDKYVAKLNEMGLNEVLKVQQVAYDRYVAK